MPRQPWLRLYTAILDNPKIQLLSDSLFRLVINLWCIAKENDGILPKPEACAFRLRMKTERYTKMFSAVLHLFDETPDGRFIPHDWDQHQYKSDVSTDRVKQWREHQRNVSCNSDETVVKQSETPRARPRASDSESVSVVSSPNTEKADSSEREIMRPEFDEQWTEFRQVAETVGLAGSSVDWNDAFHYAWKVLDFMQKDAAIQGLRDRADTPDDAALKSLPRNYLKGRKWERAVRRDVSKADRIVENMRREAERLDREETARGKPS